MSIILTITIYSVSEILDNAEESLSDTQLQRLYKSAEEFYLLEGMNLEYESNYSETVCVDIEYLVNHEYIDLDKVIDPKTNEEVEGSVKIQRDTTTDNYTYSYDKTSCGSSDCYVGHCSE